MLETRTDNEHASAYVRQRAEAKRMREDAARMRAELERLRAEIQAVRSENRQLRTALETKRDSIVPAAGGCEMELTAGTSIGPRRHLERSRGR